MPVRRIALPILIAALLAGIASAPARADDQRPSRTGRLTPEGRRLDPAGRMTPTGLFPLGSAISPDGRWVWVVDGGREGNAVHIVSTTTGKQLQAIAIPGGDAGIAFAPDGRHAYVSGLKSESRTQASLPGAGGDVIQVFAVDPASGRAQLGTPIALPKAARGTPANDDLPPDSSVAAWPQSLAVTPDGTKLVAALGQADQAAIVDLRSGATALVAVGSYPYGVAVDPRRPRAYVSNERDGTLSVVDLDRSRVVATIGVAGRKADGYAHPEGVAADPVAHRVYVAVTDRDLVAVVDTDTLKVERWLSTSRPEATYGTAPVAVAVAPDGGTLYAADAGEDAVAVFTLAARPATAPVARTYARARSVAMIGRYVRAIAQARSERTRARLRRTLLYGALVRGCSGTTVGADHRAARRVAAAFRRRAAQRRRHVPVATQRRLFDAAVARARGDLAPAHHCPAGVALGTPAFTLLGRIPTAWYTTDVDVSADGRTLTWLAARGVGTGPSSGTDPKDAPSPSELLQGRVATLATPTDVAVRDTLTPRADRAIVPVDHETAPAGTPVRPGGPIEHVFYVVKENRTYDQVLGDDRRGDGDPRLVMFGDNGGPPPVGGVTPNAHALARRFPLLDNVYADSEESTVGHKVTSSSYANDYTQRYVQVLRGKAGNPDEFPIGTPPAGFIFDQAVRQAVPFRVYGELGAGNQPFANEGRDTFTQVQANTDPAYATQVSGVCDLPGVSSVPANGLRCVADAAPSVSDEGHTTTGRPDVQSRVGVFQSEFALQVAAGTVPALNYLILFNDHTDGDTPGVYSPKADVADNDLGLGQLVELISHSPIWDSSAIFVVEDDSQAGIDHVDAHRIPVQVISPYARLGAVVHHRYDQYSFIRTVEILLGLHPLSINDALATPLYDAFISGDAKPDAAGSRYLAIQPQQDTAEVVPAAGTANQRLSLALPWSDTDKVPQRVSDVVLWRSIFGGAARVPPVGPGSSPVETARADAALVAYRAHRSVRAALGPGDGD